MKRGCKDYHVHNDVPFNYETTGRQNDESLNDRCYHLKAESCIYCSVLRNATFGICLSELMFLTAIYSWQDSRAERSCEEMSCRPTLDICQTPFRILWMMVKNK